MDFLGNVNSFATRRCLRFSVVGLCLALSLVLAYTYALVLVRPYYAYYDDEGFMLMTLRQYIGGASLYDKMYTEYGPFYYVIHANLFTFAGWAVNHDQLRLLTVTLWVLVASGYAVCVWLWCRSLLWSLVALLTTMVVLRGLKG